MSRFVSINLAKLPDLPLPERDFEAIYVARIAELTDRLAAKGIVFDTGSIDGDPLSAVEQAGAYRELLVLTERDDAIRALMLATSWGTYLDHIGATQAPPIARKIIVPADAARGTVDVMESDDDFRARIQLAPEEFTTCGSEGAYLSFALGTEGVKVASVYGPMSFGGTPGAPFAPLGEVHVVVVATEGDGTAAPDVVAATYSQISPDQRRPIADYVTVTAAEIVHYAIEAVLKVGPGVDAGAIRSAAERRLRDQAARQHRPGAAQLRRMLYAAAAVASASGANLVEDIDLIQPSTDINAEPIVPTAPGAAYRAPFCESVTVSVEVVYD